MNLCRYETLNLSKILSNKNTDARPNIINNPNIIPVNEIYGIYLPNAAIIK